MRRAAQCALSLSLGAGLLAPAPAHAGTLRGQVELIEKKGKARDLSEVVVWVEGPEVAPEPTSATMQMKDKQFDPGLLVVPVGGSVAFPNLDGILHNAFSVSGKNKFDLELYKKPKSRSQTFLFPGIVRVYCNIHPQMVGFVMVVDSDYMAVTPESGAFELANVPAGARVLKVWHEEAQAELSVPITVKGSGTSTQLDGPIRIDVSAFQPEPHKNKYGKDYKPPPPDEDERY